MICAALAALKGIIYIKKTCTRMYPNGPTILLQKYINIKRLPNKTKKICACSVIDTAYTIFASDQSYLEFEFMADFKKALARESISQGELFDENPKGQKTHGTVPLRHGTSPSTWWAGENRQFLPLAGCLVMVLRENG
jgi:hypothetical protein